MFERVLVANRGEIAVRIVRTLHRLGVEAVAVYSDADADAPHTRLADIAVRLGAAPPADSYLHVDRVVDAAVRAGAQALHPGYGFLAENPALARACTAAGLAFVGPPAAAITLLGDKAQARQLMGSTGVPLVPGTDDGDLDDDALIAAAEHIGLPVMVKPVAGGGGKGMTVVDHVDGLPGALRSARRQALAAFGDDRLLLERFVARPRHIEVQVLADDHGGIVHLGERECSLQRRHQKIIEEAPSPLLDDSTRTHIGATAIGAARACGYRGAGTVEFIVSHAEPDVFAFLEMNTRLQVEHPVTEMVTGIDIVEWQLRIAAGEALPFEQEDVRVAGHAVEARVYAEDPAHGFLPTGGTVSRYREPGYEGVRVDSGIATGTAVPTVYDPLLAKVIAHGTGRTQALRRLRHALGDLTVLGLGTNIGFLRRLLADDDVRAGVLDTGLVARRLDALAPAPVPDHVLVAAALGHLAARERSGARNVFDTPGGWRLGPPAWTVLRLGTRDMATIVRVRGPVAAAEVAIDDGRPRAVRATLDGSDLTVTLDGRTRRYATTERNSVTWIGYRGDTWALHQEEQLQAARHADERAGPLTAPMPGTVTVVTVSDGDPVTAGQTLIVLDAMKMEYEVAAPTDGVVGEVGVRVGDQVEMGRTLAVVRPPRER